MTDASRRCGADWDQVEWAYRCWLELGHDGPHQEYGEAGEKRYLVMWADRGRR